MKKLYFTISAIALATVAMFAQGNRVAGKAVSMNNSVNTAGRVINNNTPQAAGDTVWIFDGAYSYNWNGTLPATYSVSMEDVDNLNVTPGYTVYFGAKSSFKIFYDTVHSATNLHYGHADTVFYDMATSWFASPAQANNWLEFGPIHVPTAGGTLSWAHNYLDKGFRDGYEILVNTTGIASTNYTAAPIFSVGDNDPSTVADTANTPHATWYSRSASMNAYAGQDVYIAVHHNATDMNILGVTNFILTEGSGVGVASHNNDFTIGANVPNPAVGSTTITYVLKANSTVNFTVTDMLGNVVYNQNMGNQSAGGHHINLNTSSFASGMYMYTFNVNGKVASRKFVVNN